MSGLPLNQLLDKQSLADRLHKKGLGVASAERKGVLFTRIAKQLTIIGTAPSSAVVACFVPGRIEVLGKHTDYAGGRSMLVAVERGFCLVAARRDDRSVRFLDVMEGQQADFVLEAQLVPTVGHWSNYPMTVARRVSRNFHGPLVGADIGFASDLPPAAGMSSSSALIVASFLALAALNDLARREEYRSQIGDRETLAGYLGTIENGMSFGSFEGDRGVGTFGGSEDHTAILCARPTRMVQYSYCPVRFERTVELPDDHLFAVGVSGVVADKTGTAMEKYNRVSRLARAVAEVWCQVSNRNDPHIAAALASAPDAVERIREVLRSHHQGEYSPAELLDRFEQFVAESEQIIPAVPNRLGPDLSRFGQLVDRSQSLGARLLGNQTPETIWLAERARSLGAVAASAFGAGFGGSVWSLVRSDDAPAIMDEWSARYTESFPHLSERSAFFITSAGPAAFRLDGEVE